MKCMLLCGEKKWINDQWYSLSVDDQTLYTSHNTLFVRIQLITEMWPRDISGNGEHEHERKRGCQYHIWHIIAFVHFCWLHQYPSFGFIHSFILMADKWTRYTLKTDARSIIHLTRRPRPVSWSRQVWPPTLFDGGSDHPHPHPHFFPIIIKHG